MRSFSPREWGRRLLSWGGKYRRPLSWGFVALVFILMARRLYHDWQSLPADYVLRLDYRMLATSLVALMLALLVVSSRWGLIVRVLGVPISYRQSIRIWFLSQMGRYLPGGIWNYASRFYLSRAEMSGDIAVLSMIIETLLRVLSEGLVFLVSLPFWRTQEMIGRQGIILSIIGIVGGLALLHPRVVDAIRRTPWLHRMAGGADASTTAPLPTYGRMLGLLLYYAMTVLVTGGAFWLLQQTIHSLPYSDLPVFLGIVAVSTVVGFLFPLAPNGWGVREGLMAVLLGQMMPAAIAIMVSVACRLWLSLAEWIWILIFLRWRPQLAK
ncbi:MAG TPA: flippase-like domain-containing protein [Chloroflexi bacterium]|nr:flippase-like domain-containing protein [Chloroflexota bacterium]